MSRGRARTVPARPDAGFTLLEIVVALVVLGVLLATLGRGVQFGLAAFDRQNRMIATGGRQEAVDRTLRRLIERLDPGTGNDTDAMVGTHHVLMFRSPLPIDGSDMTYDLRLSVDDHRLVLAWLPHRHAVPIGPAPPAHRETLLDGVSAIDLSYWSDGAWHDEWRQPKPPALLRIRIAFPEGDPRRWPDIVEAPARDQAGG